MERQEENNRDREENNVCIERGAEIFVLVFQCSMFANLMDAFKWNESD